MNQEKKNILGAWFLMVGTGVVLGATFIESLPFNRWVVLGGGGFMVLGAWIIDPDTITNIADQIRSALPFLDDPDGGGST